MDDDVIEFRGNILALTVFMANLLETLMASGHLTYEQVHDICYQSDMRISYMLDTQQGEIPDITYKRIEQQANSLILKLLNDTKPRR
jgi:hypothetical protein